jgi:hypothetical protein
LTIRKNKEWGYFEIDTTEAGVAALYQKLDEMWNEIRMEFSKLKKNPGDEID